MSRKVARKYGYMPPSYQSSWNNKDEEEEDSASSKDSDEENTEDGEDSEDDNEKEDGDEDGDDNPLDPPVEDVNPSETIPIVDDYTPSIISSTTLKAGASPPKGLARIVDQTGPLVETIAPIAAAAAASSIMAGSGVIDPPSPGTSASSRLNSPAPANVKDITDPPKKKSIRAKGEDNNCDSPPAGAKAEKKERPTKHVPPPLDMEVDPPEVEGDGDNEASATVDVDEPENEQEQEAEVENEVEAEVEVEEPSPDDDLEVELESDLQPAHRAEALDVLATIELKFALLRERVYVEKMEGLAWEEKLVNDGEVSYGLIMLGLVLTSFHLRDTSGAHSYTERAVEAS